MPSPALILAEGKTAHFRHAPFRRGFSYPVRMIDVDVDRLNEADDISPWLSIDKKNLLAIDTTSYGSHGRSSLGDWARKTFESAGIDGSECSVRLMTFPSIWGYAFAPISLWLLITKSDSLKGMIYEVHNTFGDDHSYVASIDSAPNRHMASKRFHVSPFFDVSGAYRFTLNYASDSLSLLIENIVDDVRTHSATLELSRKTATKSAIRRVAFTAPLSGIAVMVRIHWQALLLWLKGAKYHSRPSPNEDQITLASPAPFSRPMISKD